MLARTVQRSRDDFRNRKYLSPQCRSVRKFGTQNVNEGGPGIRVDGCQVFRVLIGIKRTQSDPRTPGFAVKHGSKLVGEKL